MNRFVKNKKLAFTLAEMMVILAIFSTIAAASLPVITARNALDNSDSATSGVAIEPWYANSSYNGLGYYNKSSALAKTNAVMFGGQVTADAYSIGYPQLSIKDNYGNVSGAIGNHIAFLKNLGGTTYAAGQIMMGNRGDNAIAIGANAIARVTSNFRSNKTVAIGSYAFSLYNNNTGDNNVAIGNRTNTGRLKNSIAIGNEACADRQNLAVCIGSGRNAAATYGVTIGQSAGSSTGNGSVSIGNYAGLYTYGDDRINIGTNAGWDYSDGGIIKSSMINIGTKAGYDTAVDGYNIAIGNNAASQASIGPSNASLSNGLFIGQGAGNSFGGCGSPVVIGSFAGYDFNFNRGESPVIIGCRAAYAYTRATISGSSVVGPVIIGRDVFMRSGGTISGQPDVIIGNYSVSGSYNTNLTGSVFIGDYIAMHSRNMQNTVCIGTYACTGQGNNGANGQYDVRITPYGYYNNSSDKQLRSGTSHIGFLQSVDAFSLNSTHKTRLFSTTSKYSNMVISPVLDSSRVASSSIILYAQNVYGPSATFDTLSDKRLKENIRPAKYGLNDIRKINIYEYKLKDAPVKTPQIGVIAQEMQKVIPEGVTKDEKGYLSVVADWLVFPMVNAIKELDKSVITLKGNLISYVKEYNLLVSRVCALDKEIKILERENKSLARDINKAYKKAKNAERR